jgi:hypothetical protein
LESWDFNCLVELGKKWYRQFSIIRVFFLHPVGNPTSGSKWHAEIDPKSDPKSVGFVSISKAALSEKQK